MTNLKKSEAAATEDKGADTAASLSLLVTAINRLVIVFESRTEATNALPDAATATPATSPVAGEAAITAADSGEAAPATSPVAGEAAITAADSGDAAPATSPVAGEAAITAVDSTTMAPQLATVPVNPVGAVAVAEAPLEPVITPEELERQLAYVDSATGKWFLVTQGLEPGVYSSWTEAAPLVIGISRSAHTKQSSKAEALGEYTKAWNKGLVIRRT